MNSLGCKNVGHFLACVFFAVVCHGQALDGCEVTPKNLTVTLGSSVTVVFKAPENGICRKKLKDFSLGEVFWKLNGKKINDSFYDHNDTHAMVTISNFSLESGTVECHIHEQVLGGTIVRTHGTSGNTRMAMEPPKKPINIGCVTNFTSSYTTCHWDGAGNSQETTYEVTLTQGNELNHCDKLGRHRCRFNGVSRLLNMTITVTAINSAGNVSTTVHLNVETTMKYHPPSIRVDPHPNRLSVKLVWDRDWDLCKLHSKCEVKYVEEGRYDINKSEGNATVNIYGIKTCTNYSLAMRCACGISMWSDWSINHTVLSLLNVSSEPLYLWRRVLEPYGNGTRLVQLMWQGPSPSCKAIDEYKLFVDSTLLKSLQPTKNYTSVLLNGKAHNISIAAYKDNVMLRSDGSFRIASIEEEDQLLPVQTPFYTTQNGVIHISWGPPSIPANKYVIEWFTDAAQKDTPSWSTTQDTNISLAGDYGVPSKLYTVTIYPVFDKGPGPGTILYTYAKEGVPAKVSKVMCLEPDNTQLTVGWEPVRRDQCCGFVVNYTVLWQKVPGGQQQSETVDHTRQQMTLRDLQPSTSYRIIVRAHSIANSSDSLPSQFTTEAYGKAFIRTLISVACGVIILLMCGVCIFILWRKVKNLMVPSPQYSSMAMWSQQKPLKPSFSNTPDMDSSPREKILKCQIDHEMDSGFAVAADTNSPPCLAENWAMDSSPSLDVSISEWPTENIGLNPSYGIWNGGGTESLEDDSEDQQQHQQHQSQQQPLQPDGISPELCQPYRDQQPACSLGGPSGTAQAYAPSEESRPSEESSQPDSSATRPAPSTYISVDVFDGQKDN